MQLRIPVRVFGAEWTLRRRGPQAKHPLTVQNLFRRADEDIGPYENAGSIHAGGHMGPPLQKNRNPFSRAHPVRPSEGQKTE